MVAPVPTATGDVFDGNSGGNCSHWWFKLLFEFRFYWIYRTFAMVAMFIFMVILRLPLVWLLVLEMLILILATSGSYAVTTMEILLAMG